MVLRPLLGLFQICFWFPARWSRGVVPCLLHSRIWIVHQALARVRKCTFERKSSNWTLLSILAHFNQVVSIRNVAKWCLSWCRFGAIRNLYQECSKRWFQWRCVNRFTLHFSRKAEICTPGSSHSSILKRHGAVEKQVWLWFEFRACLCARCAPDLSHSIMLKWHDAM